MHKQTKATAITPKVKEEVWERDHQRCVVCGDGRAEPNSHIVRRSQGGLGVPMNIVTHCHICHFKFDNYDKQTRAITFNYIRRMYPDWTREQVTYSKWTE